MTENTVEIIPPSKVDWLKSKITREGLILTGVVTGIIVAGGVAMFCNKPKLEITVLEPVDMDLVIETVNRAAEGTL